MGEMVGDVIAAYVWGRTRNVIVTYDMGEITRNVIAAYVRERYHGML
jgi:hypothetical protein